jgi:hypothetical protein
VEVLDAVAMIRAGYAALAAAPLEALSHRSLLRVADELETVTRQLPAQSHRLITALAGAASPTELGAISWREVLSRRLRISRACQDFCVCGGLQVGVDSFGVVQCERSECLLPAVGAGSFDESVVP